MKIILFGSEGMLGNYIFRYLKKFYFIETINRNEYDVIIHSFEDLENILISKNINSSTIIINAYGVIPQSSKDYLLNEKIYIKVNSIFPHILLSLCNKYKAKLIHPTTDCVYDGMKGNYIETDIHTGKDIYSISKSLGELSENGEYICIRSSIIGEEFKNKRSLIEWVKSNKNGNIEGYTNHYWNGITCLEYSKFIHKVIEKNMYNNKLIHIFSPERISKYELVCLINKIFKLNIEIKKVEKNYSDKTLNTIYSVEIEKSLEEQLIELINFN